MKKKRYPKKKTKNLYMFQGSSMYDKEYELALRDYKRYSVEALRKSLITYRQLYVSYPQLILKARMDAITNLGKEKTLT